MQSEAPNQNQKIELRSITIRIHPEYYKELENFSLHGTKPALIRHAVETLCEFIHECRKNTPGIDDLVLASMVLKTKLTHEL